MITSFHAPGGYGIRLDSHVYSGYSIPPYYDSLIGKLITYGANREEAIDRMRSALDEMIVEGVHTTIPFHRALMRDERFRAGQFDTHFLSSRINC
jgi:acetyl-CoA carboxylase biotin carboxylase subunit